MKKEYVKIKGMKEKKFLRHMEFLREQTCITCGKNFITNTYWAYGGSNPSFDHWVIGSVYCSTKCSTKGRKILRGIK